MVERFVPGTSMSQQLECINLAIVLNCTCVYIYVYMYVCIYIYMYICIYIYTHIFEGGVPEASGLDQQLQLATFARIPKETTLVSLSQEPKRREEDWFQAAEEVAGGAWPQRGRRCVSKVLIPSWQAPTEEPEERRRQLETFRCARSGFGRWVAAINWECLPVGDE